MTTPDILKHVFIALLGVVAWLLVAIAICGVPKTSKRQAEELADQAEALKARQIALEDQWIADLERCMPIMDGELVRLRGIEPTLDNINQRAKLHVLLLDAEKALITLKQRRALSNQTAATFLEGRM